MYQLKIKKVIENRKQITIANGQQIVDENNQPIETPQLDANSNVVLDVNGDPVMEPLLNTSGQDEIVYVIKTAQDIATEEQALIDAKTAEIQALCDAYEAAKEYQKQNGGPGPVADFEIMKICNEYNCQFEVIFEEE